MDPSQIVKMTFDEDRQAQRVYFVNEQPCNVSPLTVGVSQVESPFIQTIDIPTIIREIVIERIEVPVIVKEIEVREIQVPVIIKELEIREIEKQVLIPSEIQLQIVEKEVIPRWVKGLLIGQFGLIISLLLKYIL